MSDFYDPPSDAEHAVVTLLAEVAAVANKTEPRFTANDIKGLGSRHVFIGSDTHHFNRRAIGAFAMSVAVAVLVIVLVLSFRALPSTKPSGVPTSRQDRSVTKPTPSVQPSDCNCGVLAQFAPVTPTTWWAAVQGNMTGITYVVRTDDSGKVWKKVLPASSQEGSSYFFLNAEVAWVGGQTNLYRTIDGGASWRRMKPTPIGCQLDFVDDVHGWCYQIGAAAGSEGVSLYRTSDGGDTWALVSETNPPGTGPTTADSLPFGCDKSIIFSTATVGWAYSTWCNGGSAYIYKSTDGGRTWRALPHLPLASADSLHYGVGFGQPIVSGAHITIPLDLGGAQGSDTVIAASSDDGITWQTHRFPGSIQYWNTDLINFSDWFLTFGSALESTTDAGLHWTSITLPKEMSLPPSGVDALTLMFSSPQTGWATPGEGSKGAVWWTRDGGASWKQILIDAGPYKV